MDLYFKHPDETYRAYQRFLKRNEPEKAYRCLERLLKQFPDDIGLLDDIVTLAVAQLQNSTLARSWLVQRIKIASYWPDYVLLSRIEAEGGNIAKAKEHLAIATKLQRKQRFLMGSPREAREALDRAREFIRLQEHHRWVRRVSSLPDGKPMAEEPKAVVPLPTRKDARAMDRKKFNIC